MLKRLLATWPGRLALGLSSLVVLFFIALASDPAGNPRRLGAALLQLGLLGLLGGLLVRVLPVPKTWGIERKLPPEARDRLRLQRSDSMLLLGMACVIGGAVNLATAAAR